MKINNQRQEGSFHSILLYPPSIVARFILLLHQENILIKNNSNFQIQMATDNSSNSRQRLIAIAAVVIALLLGTNIFLLINKTKQDAKNQQLTTQLSEAEQLKVQLEKDYYEALSELEQMKGTNDELNALIEEQKNQLQEQKNRIDRLLRDNGSLSQARTETQRLKNQAQEYVAQINQLKAENEALKGQTVSLSRKADSLRISLQEKSFEAEELSTAKAALSSEREALAMENTKLAEKVDIASVIKVQGLQVTGYKTKGSGKAVKQNKAKDIDNLQICFNTTVNNVVNGGRENFYVRIINPIGETLAVEDLGSGMLDNKETKEKVRYTKSAQVDYAKSEENVCVNWTPNIPFEKGKYEVQIYNKGFLAGAGNFELK